MASRCRSLTKPTFSVLKSTITIKPTTFRPTTTSASLLLASRSSQSLTRTVSRLGCVQSLLPFHSAVSAARLTSCLGIDAMSSRSLSQGMICGANQGV